MSIATRRADLETIRAKYVAALEADDLRQDISLDGESTDRVRWRDQLTKALADIDGRLAKMRPPYQLRQGLDAR